MPTFEAVKGTFLRVIGGIVLLALLVYALDYVVLRLRGSSGLGSVVVTPFYEIHEKSGKTEFDFKDPVAQPCVNSLFPHTGYEPCWYLERNPQQKIEI
jgi:hypothetical protein